jgi:ATP-dependent DNA helicase DinG
VQELLLDSPFDFRKNSLLYTPADLPPPGSHEFLEVAAARVVDLVSVTDGGAFVLTTSLRAMAKIHELLAARLGGRRLFLQGQAPKQALISAFRAAGDAVLVATQSFWEGVDVPGRALRLVVLEKLPFFVPTDPIVRARSLAIERDGGNPFMDLFVPSAALALKQGFGRLIRTQRDVGIVALLDERVHKKIYAKLLLRSARVLGPGSTERVLTRWRQLSPRPM